MPDSFYNLGRIDVKRRKANTWFKRGMPYRKAVDVRRGATELTVVEIATAILKAKGVGASEDDMQSVAHDLRHRLKNHDGKSVERVGESVSARWHLCSSH